MYKLVDGMLFYNVYLQLMLLFNKYLVYLYLSNDLVINHKIIRLILDQSINIYQDLFML